MSNIFMISFVIILILTFIKDLPRLQASKISRKILYGLISLSSLVLLINWRFHMHIPLPAHFFVRTVSPWVNRIIGI